MCQLLRELDKSGPPAALRTRWTKANKSYDLVVLNEHPHAVQGQTGRYMNDRTAAYFLEHLRP